MYSHKILVVIFLTIATLACGGAEEAEAPREETPAAATPAAPPLDPTQAATITGKVTFEGEAPKPVRIFMSADPVCDKQHSQAVFVEETAIGEGGALKNVFVWVKDGLGNRAFDTPREAVSLDQKGCVYTPHVFGVQVGQEIQILNSDPTTHNIHPLPQQNREWNESQPPNVPPKVKTFARQEVMIPVKCNVHPWMKSYIGVVAHPFFAVTSGEGTFEIKGLPPGEYTIEAWHEKFGTSERKVTLQPTESQEISFSFKG